MLAARTRKKIRNLWRGQSGQVLPWVAMSMMAMISVSGLTVDVGRAYVAHSQLQNYANAAALAAAGEVYNTSSLANAVQYANLYSASAGDQNVNPSLGTVTTSVITKCLNMLQPSGSGCTASSANNAVQVKQTASVPTFFMRMFGVPSLSISATATATMQGVAKPWNLAIILDATGSMTNTDKNCGGISEFQCALNGIEGLLATTNPCSPGVTNCSGSSANFHVSLFSFPNVSTSTLSDDVACSSNGSSNPNWYYGWYYGWGGWNQPTFDIYTLPLPGASSYTPTTYTSWPGSWTASYEITYGASDADANGFVSNYYLASAQNKLNPNSSIVKAVTTCMSPITSTGGGNGALQGVYSGGITYYASAIYAAQSALVAEQKLYPNAYNAIIFLSDGQANLLAGSGDFPTAFSAYPSNSGYNTLTSTGQYPSARDECQQAIIAAQAATDAGTTVFGVAYGSEQQGCTTGPGATDTSLIATGRNAPFTLSSLTPCVTIENIASSLGTFYSDYQQSGSGIDLSCVDNSHTVVNLNDIFQSISSSFTTPRLLPNNAT
jgi:Flp pilus assembly protein TadG